MGLGGGPGEWDDYEWVRLADLPAQPPPPPVRRAGPPPLADAVLAWLARRSLWTSGAGTRVLLVDLDNLRADPVRWRDRMTMVVALARQADVVALAGQEGPVRRARPHLAEFAPRARAVADGSDLADHVLLEAAGEVPGAAQFVVLSNDWIFAGLASRGPLTVLSPGGDALSDRLRDAATRVVDLAAVEAAPDGREPRKAAFRASRRRRSPAAVR
ncbi:MAG TPA: hypothetical protein VE547_05940 [Mycobacteriales bacterium]|jgi:hypothetical protein|nr:hypothetical protein [Mycobacteriales bacterium]